MYSARMNLLVGTAISGTGAGKKLGLAGSKSLGAGIGEISLVDDSIRPEERGLLRGVIHSMYDKIIPLRPHIRGLIAGYLREYLRDSSDPSGVPELLSITAAFVQGFTLPLRPIHSSFFTRFILPLHRPNTMVSALEPVLVRFHAHLVYVVIQFLKKDRTLLKTTLKQILLAWPPPKYSNSAKEVLLIHEIEKLLEFTDAPMMLELHRPLFTIIRNCVVSENARVAQRALQMWQNDLFVSLLSSSSTVLNQALTLFFPALMRQKHWNSSVNKMRVNVLQIFLGLDERVFEQCADHFWQQKERDDQQLSRLLPHHSAKLDTCGSTQAKESGGGQETEGSAGVLKTLEWMQQLTPVDPATHNPVLASRLAAEELLKTQVLVPDQIENLNYFNLVFGHNLGDGSYAEVRYAKKTQAGIAGSHWKEYAVKVISHEVIKSQCYEENVQREIQIMRALAHPNITRLCGTCSSKQSLYLVLEYAHKGDLHNHISKMGSLSVESARFIAAEILNGLEYMHAQGVVYGDLKPENILIHKSGHIKLADFGSSRFTREGKQGNNTTMEAGSDAVCNDREEGGNETNDSALASVGADMDNSSTSRLEGTLEYLPPEVIRREAGVTFTTDLWAYGCVVYQLLAGRTPVWAGEGGVDGDGDDTSADAQSRSMEMARLEQTRSDRKDKLKAKEKEEERKRAREQERVKCMQHKVSSASSFSVGFNPAKGTLGGLRKKLRVSTPSLARGGASKGNCNSAPGTLSQENDAASPPALSSAQASRSTARNQEQQGLLDEESQRVMDKIVRFSFTDDKFPKGFPADCRDLVERLLDTHPRRRMQFACGDGDGDGSTTANAKAAYSYSGIKAHPFFAGVDFSTIHQNPAPELVEGAVAAAPSAKWARRKNSIMFAPMPTKFSFGDTQYIMPVIEESPEEKSYEAAHSQRRPVNGIPKHSAPASSSLSSSSLSAGVDDMIGVSAVSLDPVQELDMGDEQDGKEDEDAAMAIDVLYMDSDGDNDDDDDLDLASLGIDRQEQRSIDVKYRPSCRVASSVLSSSSSRQGHPHAHVRAPGLPVGRGVSAGHHIRGGMRVGGLRGVPQPRVGRGGGGGARMSRLHRQFNISSSSSSSSSRIGRILGSHPLPGVQSSNSVRHSTPDMHTADKSTDGGRGMEEK